MFASLAYGYALGTYGTWSPLGMLLVALAIAATSAVVTRATNARWLSRSCGMAVALAGAPALVRVPAARRATGEPLAHDAGSRSSSSAAWR